MLALVSSIVFIVIAIPDTTTFHIYLTTLLLGLNDMFRKQVELVEIFFYLLKRKSF